MRPPLLALLALSLAIGLISCSQDDGPAQPGGTPLDDVSLSVGTVTALDKVYLLGLPAARRDAGKTDHDDLAVRFLVDGTERADAPVEVDADGHFFRAILHPDTPNDGGMVGVQVTDGTHASPEIVLGLEPLPAAPGAYQRLIEALRALVEQRAGWAGTSVEELASLGFDEVPEPHLSLKFAQSYLDGAGPNSLTSLIANDAGFLTAEERELLDRMFGHARLDLVVQADIDEFSAGAMHGTQRRNQAGDRPARRSCIDVGPTITTAQELVDAMVLAALGEAALDPDGAGRYLEAVAYLFTGLGTVPGAGRVFTVAGVGIAIWQAATAAVRGTYPSELTALQYELDKSTLAEDDDEPARWWDVELTARSTGWVADQSLVNTVISAVGAYVSIAHASEIEALDAIRDVEVASFNADLQGHLDDNDGLIEFCVQTWTVDISDPDFSTAGALEGRFAVDRDAQTLTPLEVGQDVLRIATVTGLFAGQDIHRDEPLETRPITVVVEPAVIRVEEPGEVVQITARIQDAEVTSLFWSAEQGTWQDGIGDDTNDGTTRPLQTPAQPELYPFRVEVESTSRQGLRASGEPRRADFTEIRLDDLEITITPRDTCIQPGDTVQFRAWATDGEEHPIVWTREEGYGSIDQNGLYQAPGEGVSSAVISAHIAGMEEVSDTTTVEARGCNCYFLAHIGAYSFGSADVAYNDVGGIYQFYFETGSEVALSLSIGSTDETPRPEPGDTGLYEVSVSFHDGTYSWVALVGNDQEDGEVFLDLEELTGEFMRGQLNGTAVRTNTEGDVVATIPVAVSFQAGNWDEGWPCE